MSLATAKTVLLDSEFITDLTRELKRARVKHPTPHAMLAAIGEETGEVCQAIMDKPWSEVRKECLHLAAVALRLATEGDPTHNTFRASKGLDHLA